MHRNIRLAQWPTAAHAHGGVVHVGDVLTDPAIELRLQVAALFPGANVFALDDLDVVSQATDHEDVGQLSAEFVVQLRFLAFFVIAKILGFLTRVGGEERGIVGVLAHGQGNKTLLGQLEFPSLGDQHIGGDFGLHLTHGFVVVNRQVTDRAAALRADDVGTPAILGEAVGQPAGKRKGGIAPQEVVVAGVHAFVVAELPDGHRLFPVRRTQQEVRQRQPHKPRVFALAKRIPLDELWAFEHGLQVFQVGQLGKTLDAKKLRARRCDEGRVRHRRYGSDGLQQLDVLRARVELVIADDGAEWLAAELSELCAVNRLVETRARDLRGVFKVVQQLLLGHTEHFQAVVFTKIGTVDQKFQRTP